MAPESAAGGPLALVRTGDWIELDVGARSLRVDIPDDELRDRLVGWSTTPPAAESGYARLYIDHVQQADLGADFDFLRGCRGAAVGRESH